MKFNQIILIFLLSIAFHQINFAESTGFLWNKLTDFRKNLATKVNSVIKSPFHKIHPGTLWCGAGSIAKNYEDLGLFQRVDSCCREHDNCPITLSPGEGLPYIYNGGSYTHSHCDCDTKFYNCLKSLRTVASREIGKKYFNILSPSCFTYDYPVIRCLQYEGMFKRKCIRYEVNPWATPVWQWRDNKLF